MTLWIWSPGTAPFQSQIMQFFRFLFMFKLVKPPTLKVLSPIGTLLYSLLYVTLNEKCMAKKKNNIALCAHWSNSRGSHAFKVQVTKATNWWLALSTRTFFQEWINEKVFSGAEFNYSCQPAVMSNSQGIFLFNFGVHGEWCLSFCFVFFLSGVWLM